MQRSTTEGTEIAEVLFSVCSVVLQAAAMAKPL